MIFVSFFRKPDVKMVDKAKVKAFKLALKGSDLYGETAKTLLAHLKVKNWLKALAAMGSWNAEEMFKIEKIARKIDKTWQLPKIKTPTRPVAMDYLQSRLLACKDDKEVLSLIGFGAETGRRLSDVLRLRPQEVKCRKNDSILITPGYDNYTKQQLLCLSKSGKSQMQRPYVIYKNKWTTPIISFDDLVNYLNSTNENAYRSGNF